MSKEYVMYKNFDELPGELKEKFKSRARGYNLSQSKEGYLGFINLLSQRGDKLVGEYVGREEKTQVKFGECNHIADISPNSYKNGRCCGVCNGKQVQKGYNDLATTHQHLAKEWHPTKNELTPYDVTQSSGKKVWWQCEKGHEWNTAVASRTNGCGCPYCSNKKILKGYNDIATTHPQYVKYFTKVEDIYTHAYGSSKKVELKCPECGHVKTMKVTTLTRQGFSCDLCSDGVSYPEKLMGSILKRLKINFIRQMSYDNGEHRYDFYLPEYDAIFETHGLQHYLQGFKKFGKTLAEEQKNDRYKEQLALENGIKHYHQIDCRYSTLEWCRHNIEDVLIRYVDVHSLTDEDWKEADIQAQKSLKIEVCKYWKEHKEIDSGLTPQQVADVFWIAVITVRDYLKWGSVRGFCEYESNAEKDAKIKRQSIFAYLVKPNGDKWFEKPMSMREMERATKISSVTIARNLNKGALKQHPSSKYDPKYIGSRVVSAEVYDNQTQAS